MSWLSDATGVDIRPGKKVTYSKPSWDAQKKLLGAAAGAAVGYPVAGALGGAAMGATTAAGLGGILGGSLFGKSGGDVTNVAGSNIPDYTSQWETLAQDLNTKKTMAAQEQATAQSMGALADTQNKLAMRGGLSSGASERLAADAMNQRQSAWNQLAQAGMLGSADVAKQGLEKKQDMALQIAQGKDMQSAYAAANKPKKNIFGGDSVLIPGIL